MDWNAIKTEYITDQNSSYRKLGKKYGVGYQTIAHRAKAEDWISQREQYIHKTVTKTIARISDKEAGRAARIMSVADKLLDKIEAAVDDFEMREMLMDSRILRQVTGALKDIKDIQSVKSDADLREQEARIEKLRKEAQGEDARISDIEVTFNAGKEEWNE